MYDNKEAAEAFLDEHFGKHDPQPWTEPVIRSTGDVIDKNKWDSILAKKSKPSAPGENRISYEMLRKLNPQVVENLLMDLNRMWRRGFSEDALRSIRIVAIPKPGRDQTTPSGKRPISLVPTITKVVNTAVLERLQTVIDERNILPPTSFGFRKGLSTNTCLEFIVNEVKNLKRQKMKVALICVDLSNAFNAVKPDILNDTLVELRIPDEIILWIAGFLQNRRLSLQIRGATITRTINSGLPQGDILSPTLFNLYTRKLHDIGVGDDVILVQYADDFGILVKGKSLEQLNLTVQNYMDKFIEAAENLNFRINAEKTKGLLFHNSDNKLTVKINGTQVETVRVHRHLGVQIDSFLSFRANTREVARKVTDRLNMLKVISGIKTGSHPQTMANIYKALIRSVLEYGCTVQNNASATNKRKLEVANNQCLRKVTGCTKSTPLNALTALAGQYPLHLRQEHVANKQIARSFSRNNVVATQLRELEIPDDLNLEKYSYLEKMYIRNKNIFDDIMPVVKLHATTMEVHPYLEGLDTAKKETNPFKMKQLVLFTMNNKYRGRRRIFTDASKEGERCGVGIYLESCKRRHYYRLEQESSITAAEMTAIKVAISFVEQMELHNCVIYTDSKSACMILEDSMDEKAGSTIVAEILRIAHRFGTAIQWIPSHVEVEGNEIADKLAKLGLSDIAPTYGNRLCLNDALHRFKIQTQDNANRWYQDYSMEKGKRFSEIFPVFSTEPWYYKVQMEGRDVRLTNRLMTGHDFSKYWLAKMKIAEDEDCDMCEVPETSEHIIVYCPKHGFLRLKFQFEQKYLSLTALT
nr:uncharacterized protein LOC115263670 [Aedes albopictus]